jgi:hypothetical protein
MVSVGRIELPSHGPKPRILPLNYTEKYGAGCQNRTDDRRLEICCFAIKLIPQMLSIRRGNYRASRIKRYLNPSHAPSTHSPRIKLSYCQRYFGMSSTTLELRTHFSSCGSQYPDVTPAGSGGLWENRTPVSG